MIREIQIGNYKSIRKLKLNPGRITVFIGENGSGKSNILEAIALGSAAANNKLDNEFLSARGIRVTEPQFMRSVFDKEDIVKDIPLSFKMNHDLSCNFLLHNENTTYSKWTNRLMVPAYSANRLDNLGNRIKYLENRLEELTKGKEFLKVKEEILPELERIKNDSWFKGMSGLQEFLIYSPENPSLRIFGKEGQIQPLGIYGEGLFKLLKVLNDEDRDKFSEIKERLRLISWFEDFEMSDSLSEQIWIKDRFADEGTDFFNQKSANQGFLFLLFYFALFISDDTPGFFAVDNIDESLSPKLCRRLIKELAELAEKYDKQVIFTTHNPAILDGLNLDDDEQRLFVIFRNKLGETKAKRIFKPKPPEGQKPVRMSEAFLR